MKNGVSYKNQKVYLKIHIYLNRTSFLPFMPVMSLYRNQSTDLLKKWIQCFYTMAALDWNKLILTTTFSIYYFLFPWRNMVCKEVSTPPPPPPISKPCPHFLKLHILPPYHQIGHPKFPYSQKYRNASVKLSSINTTHVKQQHCWLFHFGMFI